MKKTMIALALAGACATAFAAEKPTEGVAQVYRLQVKVNTMTAAKAKISSSSNPFVYGTEEVIYRKPSTVTWYGLVWGCDCETVLGKWEVLPNNPNSVSGAVIWSKTSPYNIILLDDMRWHVLGAVDKNGRRCEVAWTIGESSDDSAAFLAFSGFGTLTLKGKRSNGETEIYCTSYIKSVTGTVSGWMPAPGYYTKGKEAVCTFCSVVDEGAAASYETAVSWNFCPCASVGDNDFTAVSGKWQMKYDATLSKRLANTNTDVITKAYTGFPSSVKKAIESKIAAVKAGDDGDDGFDDDDDDDDDIL